MTLISLILTIIQAIIAMLNGQPINEIPLGVTGEISVTLDTLAGTFTATNLWFVTRTPDTPDPPPDPPAGYIGIYNIDDLQAIGNDPDYPLDGYYVLMNDIDASATVGWNGGAGFAPIGTIPDPPIEIPHYSPFTGTFNGNGFRIDGLTINRPTETQVALFSGNSGRISNLYVTGNVLGNSQVSMLVGILLDGIVSKCCVAGLVEGNEQVGGAVGRILWSGGEAVPEARDCWAHVAVTGHGTYVGGFVGLGAMYCNRCWSAGAVVNDEGYESFTGGFAGYLGPANSCYYDTTTSGQVDYGKGEPRTTAAMMQQATFVGWDFGVVWTIDEGVDYPRLMWE